MRHPHITEFWYGGDYNPEQWPRAVWDDDIRLMRQAGVTVVTVGVFAWAKLEPEDGRFEFDWLDDILGRLHAGGVRVDLATATASPPAWLALAHPETLPVTADGVRLSVGSRQQYNPSSAVYRRYAGRLVRQLAERYARHPALEAWHINNELACHLQRDYSEETAVAFRTWLEARYQSIDRLNDAWGTAFWSQHYGSFREVTPPRTAPYTPNPTQLLDFDRFSSDAWLEVYQSEAAILREVTPNVPITTNFMGFFKALDYWRHAKEVDFVSDDHYPDPADPAAPMIAAATRDLMRSLGDGPWVLMEQSTSAVNWRLRNAPKPPGMHRLLSLQSVARGADGIMQFQWRQSLAGSEKFHSAMVPHAGEHTRVFEETVSLGSELRSLRDVRGLRQIARVAILLDWDSWWALEQPSVPAALSYVNILLRWYKEFWRRGIIVDFAHPESDLSKYALTIAAATQVMSAPAQANLVGYAENGGVLVVGYQTAVLDEQLHVIPDGYLGELQAILGLRIEEFAPPAEPSLSGGSVPALAIDGLAAGSANEWGEVLQIGSAEILARFSGGMLDGCPAITRNRAGRGAAFYVATSPDDLGSVVEAALAEARVQPEFSSVPANVEVVRRGDYQFLLNWSSEEVIIEGAAIPPLGAEVRLIRGSASPTSPPSP